MMNRKTLMIFVFGLVIGITGAFFILNKHPKAAKIQEVKAVSTQEEVISPKSVPSYDKTSGLFSDFEGKDPVEWGGVKTEIVSCDYFVQENGEVKIENGKTGDDPSAMVHSPSSNKCLKVVYPKGEFPGLSARRLPKDWSGFNLLVFDVYNPSDDVIKFGILIKDEPGGHPYHNRYDGEFAFRPGYSKFIFNVTGLKTNDGRRQMDISQVKELIIFLNKPQQTTTLYFDNIRLEKAPGADVAGMRRFDFGTEYSEVWPGFTQVTPRTQYSEELGYGWQVTSGLTAQDRQYPDALFRDWVRGTGPFNIDVDNGEYVVYLMLEDPGFWEYYQNYPERKIIAEGKVVGHETLPPEVFLRDYYFANLNREDLPGADVFQDYVQKRFVWRRFEIAVEDGQLNLRFEPGHAYANTLSALILAPKESDDQVRDYLKKLDEQRREFFNAAYTERIPKFPELSDSVKQRFEEEPGFIAFVKNYIEPMFPHEPPRSDQVQEGVDIFVTPGETEPFVLGFYPLKDLGRYQAAVSDLVNEQGQKISLEHIQVRSVQYKLKLVGPRVYTVRGELLRNTNLTHFKKGVTRFMWFTVSVPQGTPPGEYHGGVAVRSIDRAEDKMLVVPLRVRVLPFELEPLDIPIGLFYSVPPQFDWYPGLKDQKWTAIEFQLKDIRDHGMNTLALGLSPSVRKIHDNGKVDLNFQFFNEFMRAYRHFGFDQPISGYGMNKVLHHIRQETEGNKRLYHLAAVNAFKQIMDNARLLSGQDIVIGLADEISNVGGEGLESVIDIAKVLNEAGIPITGYFNSENDAKVFPYFKKVTINNGMKISERLLNQIQKTGNDLWFYNIGMDRFTFGFYLWRTGVKGRVQWHYQLPAVDPFFDLDGRESDYCASYPSFDIRNAINAPWFEQAREGIDDYRYLLTLEKKIQKIKLNCRDARPCVSTEEAEKLLESLRKDISVELANHQWLPSEYDNRRRDVAEMIMGLINK